MSQESQEKYYLNLISEVGQKMRIAQKNYFKSRGQSDLNLSKQLEKEFDQALKEYENFKNLTTGQLPMFDKLKPA